MLTVDDYGRLRRAHRDGMSIRAIARTLHHSRRKTREVLACPEPRPYERTKDPPAPKLGPLKPVIDEVLKADEKAPRKQRHTATQIFRRLRDEHGYAGGYDQVRRYVGRHRRDQRETFIPLVHEPGQRLECDFGHIYVDFPDGRRRVPVSAGARQYVLVLQLLAEHPVRRVQRAVECGRGPEDLDADRIIRHTRRLATQEAQEAESQTWASPEPDEALSRVQVPLRGLDHFDQYLSREGECAYA